MGDILGRVRSWFRRWHYKRIQRRIALGRALYILCQAHTREDNRTGFTVEASARLDWYGEVDQARYIAAWRTVRLYLGEPTEPTR